MISVSRHDVSPRNFGLDTESQFTTAVNGTGRNNHPIADRFKTVTRARERGKMEEGSQNLHVVGVTAFNLPHAFGSCSLVLALLNVDLRDQC